MKAKVSHDNRRANPIPLLSRPGCAPYKTIASSSSRPNNQNFPTACNPDARTNVRNEPELLDGYRCGRRGWRSFVAIASAAPSARRQDFHGGNCMLDESCAVFVIQ